MRTVNVNTRKGKSLLVLRAGTFAPEHGYLKAKKHNFKKTVLNNKNVIQIQKD